MYSVSLINNKATRKTVLSSKVGQGYTIVDPSYNAFHEK